MEVRARLSSPPPPRIDSPRLALQTQNVRAGFLCNKEVLSILQSQRDARAAQIKTLGDQKAARVAKLNRRAYAKEAEDDEVARLQPGDLHTVTFEVSIPELV